MVFQWKYLNRKLPGTQAKPEHSIVAVETQEDHRSRKRDPRKRDPEALVSDESHRKPSEEWKLRVTLHVRETAEMEPHYQ